MNEDFDQVDQEDPIPLPKGFTPIKKSGSEIPLPKGFEPVKKKVSIADIGMAAKGGGEVGVSKAPSGLTVTGEETELDRSIRERQRQATQINFDENDPVKSALLPIENKIAEARQIQKASSTSTPIARIGQSFINKGLVAEKNAIEKSVFKNVEEAELFLKGKLDPTKLVPNKPLDITNPPALEDYTEESLLSAIPNDNLTAKKAAEKFILNKQLREDIANSTSLSEAAIKNAVRKGDVTSKQITELGGDIPNQMKGLLVLNFLNSQELREEASKNPELMNRVRQEIFDLPDKYPLAAIRIISEMVSKKREQKGYNNGILNMASLSVTDDIVNELVEGGELPIQYKYLYEKPGVRMAVNSSLKTPGFVENLLTGTEQGLMGIGKTVADVTGIRNIYSDKGDRTFKALEKQYSDFAFKSKGLFHEATTHGGLVTGQVLPMMGGGSLIKAAGIVNSTKAANAIMAGLQTFGENKDRALVDLPGESSMKQLGYATTLTGIEVALSSVLDDTKLAKSLMKGVSPEVKTVINKFTNKEITSEAAKKEVVNIFSKAIEIAPNFLKGTGKGAIKEANEEAGTEILQTAANQVFGGEPIEASRAAEDAFEVWRTTFLGSLFLGIGGGVVEVNKNPTMPKLIYEMAENPDKYIDIIEGQAAIDENYAKDIQQKISNLEYISKVKQDLDGVEMSRPQKERFLLASLNQKILSEQSDAITDPTLKKKPDEKIKELEAVKQDILSTPVELTPEQQLIKKAIDSGEISEDNMYLSDALTNPETANSLLETIASQAQGEVAPEFGDAKEAMVRQFGKTLVNEAIAKYPKLEKQNQDIVGEPEQISQPIELSIEIPESEKGFPKVEYEDAVETTNVDILEQKNKLTEQKDAEVKEAERANQQSQQQATKESKPIIESEKNSNGAGKEPPKPPVENKMDESSGESNLDYMANNVPETGEVEAYLSGDTIKKHTKESPENNQERGVMELRQSLEHGIETIKEAKRVFGEDYVEKTLDYIDKSKMGVSNKALMYVSLENELGKEKITNPEKAQEISKLQSLVYEKSQAFARENSKALNYQRLRKFAQAGYDISKVTDNFFSTEELVARRTLNKAVEANADVINEAYAAQETGALTPEVEKLINEGIAKEVERLYEQLPKEKKSIAEKAIKALEAVQAKIRSRTYDAGLGVPVAFVDAGITVIKLAIKAGVKIADAIEMGIAKIKEKLGDKKWYKEDEFRKYLQDVFKPVEEIAQKTKPVKDIVKEALIEKGFGREINVKGEKRNILDWKKLAGAAGSISNIRKNVNEVLQQKGWAGLSDTQKGVIKEDFIKEYVALRESVISKAQTELAKRNKETVTPEQKTAAKKLAELYTFGIFDGNFDEYENALNKALGAKVSEQGFNDAKKIARALENIYKSTFKGVLLNDVSAKSAIEKLEDQIRILLFREAKAQGNFNLKAANIVRTYFETSQTMLLNNMKQAFENPLSGLSQNAIDAIEGIQAGTSNKELRSQRREAMKNIYKDMVINGGITYGKIESQFVNRQHLDDLVNRMSDNKIYHGIMSTVTGKATLNAMDAMFKLAITEKKFATNLIKILTHKSNPKAMSKEDALKFVTEKLTGQTYKDAQVTAKKVIEEINKNAGVELIKPEQTQIDRFANDIVKASLEMGGKITTEQITAAYNAAYKAAGLGLGHEANNPLSGMIKGYSAKLEGDINRALKDKEWNRAAMLIYKSVLFRNILNPFVGGGTNWLVLKLEKAGLGLATGLIYKFGSKSQLDLSSELGQKQLEARLYNHARYKDNFMRGLVGGIVSTSGYLLYRGLSDEDEEKYRKMRKENPWAARYLDVVTPEVTLAEMGIKDNKFKQYIEKSYNRGDAFDPVTKVIKGVDYAIKGEKGKMWGAFGEAVGTKTNAPLPWRLFKDGQVLYQGITGQDPYHGNYKPSDGFLSGVTQGGVLEWLGVPRSVSESQGNTINLKYKNKKDEYINRDATIEENKKYEDEKVKETNRMLSEYEKGKKVTINRYGEVSLKSDSKGKEVDYNKLTETQQKELLSAIKESAGDYSKSKLLDEIK